MSQERCRRAEKKGSECWNEEVGRAMAEKRRALRNGFREEIELPMTDTGYREWCETGSQVAKIMADRRWGERLGNDFEGNKKIFWKEVKRVRKGKQARDKMVKDVNGQLLRDGLEVRRRSAEYLNN